MPNIPVVRKYRGDRTFGTMFTLLILIIMHTKKCFYLVQYTLTFTFHQVQCICVVGLQHLSRQQCWVPGRAAMTMEQLPLNQAVAPTSSSAPSCCGKIHSRCNLYTCITDCPTVHKLYSNIYQERPSYSAPAPLY